MSDSADRSDLKTRDLGILGHMGWVGLILVLIVSFCVQGCSQVKPVSADEMPAEPLAQDPGFATAAVIENGDMVAAVVTAFLADGRAFFSNDSGVVGDAAVEKVEWFYDATEFSPEEVVAGQSSAIPGLGQGVVGMAPGEEKMIRVPADKAYGASKPGLIKTFPRKKNIPRTFTWTAQEYFQRFETFPTVGHEFPLSPYVKTRIAEVNDSSVRMENLAEDGREFSDDFGKTQVHVDEKEIHLVLVPTIGADFHIQGKKGKIIRSDEDSFQVDFNSPLAGRDIELRVRVLSVVAAKSLADVSLPFLENYDEALAKAAEVHKPVILVLHRDGCAWCERLLNETLEDPRVKRFHDDFIWLRINSGHETQFQERFGQKGFPMIVYLGSDGTVIGKEEGFQDGRNFSLNLKRLKAEI